MKITEEEKAKVVLMKVNMKSNSDKLEAIIKGLEIILEHIDGEVHTPEYQKALTNKIKELKEKQAVIDVDLAIIDLEINYIELAE